MVCCSILVRQAVGVANLGLEQTPDLASHLAPPLGRGVGPQRIQRLEARVVLGQLDP